VNKKETEIQSRPKDRKLGDEWSDWDGDPDQRDNEIDEKISTFYILAGIIVLFLVAMMCLIWYMVKPRVDQFHPSLTTMLQWSGIGFIALFSLFVILESTAFLKFKKSILPYQWIEKFLLFILPMSIWLGKKFGISRDRVGNSYIKIHNIITKLNAVRLNTDKLLILLPRCLKREVRTEILNRLDKNTDKILTVGGGEEARKAIRQFNPSFILAFACERDLISGLKDTAEKVPVIAIPNKRPEGPCKNTHVLIEELDEVLAFIKDKKAQGLVTRIS
jgi:hypothetical protein